MTTRTARNESANAEILGVVILIGIFAITAGIISATTLASPEPVKVPAASIEINGSPGAIHIAHLGGDSAAPERLVIRVTGRPAAAVRPIRVSDPPVPQPDASETTPSTTGSSAEMITTTDWDAPRPGLEGQQRRVGDRELGSDRHLRPARPVRALRAACPWPRPRRRPSPPGRHRRRPGTPRSRTSPPTSRPTRRPSG